LCWSWKESSDRRSAGGKGNVVSNPSRGTGERQSIQALPREIRKYYFEINYASNLVTNAILTAAKIRIHSTTRLALTNDD
jgi:hypothetical protein